MTTPVEQVFKAFGSIPSEQEKWTVDLVPAGDVIVISLDYSLVPLVLALGGANVTALSDNADLLKRLAGANKFSKKPTFKLMHPLWRWEFPDESIDAVVCLCGFGRFVEFDASGYFEDLDLSKKSTAILKSVMTRGDVIVLSEASRVLKPGGLFIISISEDVVEQVDLSMFELEDVYAMDGIAVMALRK